MGAYDQEQHLEVNFMKPLDTAANLALERIMRGDSAPWDSEQRSAWTRYILSLMFRNPTAVQVIRDHIAEMWDVGIKEFEANYVERRRETGSPATFEGVFCSDARHEYDQRARGPHHLRYALVADRLVELECDVAQFRPSGDGGKGDRATLGDW
jgi:hypothetical protein